jgi:hypothetical protein
MVRLIRAYVDTGRRLTRRRSRSNEPANGRKGESQVFPAPPPPCLLVTELNATKHLIHYACLNVDKLFLCLLCVYYCKKSRLKMNEYWKCRTKGISSVRPSRVRDRNSVFSQQSSRAGPLYLSPDVFFRMGPVITYVCYVQ